MDNENEKEIYEFTKLITDLIVLNYPNGIKDTVLINGLVNILVFSMMKIDPNINEIVNYVKFVCENIKCNYIDELDPKAK